MAGFWAHPSVVAKLRKCTEDEARAWLEKNAELQQIGDGYCWFIRMPDGPIHVETVNEPDGSMSFMGIPIKRNL